MHLAGSTELAVWLQALLCLQGQLGASGTAIGNVCAIDVPSGIYRPLEDDLQGIVASLLLRDGKGDRVLELSQSYCSYIYI